MILLLAVLGSVIPAWSAPSGSAVHGRGAEATACQAEDHTHHVGTRNAAAPSHDHHTQRASAPCAEPQANDRAAHDEMPQCCDANACCPGVIFADFVAQPKDLPIGSARALGDVIVHAAAPIGFERPPRAI